VNGYTETRNFDDDGIQEQLAKFGGTYDTSQFMFHTNIVDAIKTGTGIGNLELQQQGLGGAFRFYSASPICCNAKWAFVKGN